jgi:hypothetical protein
LASQAAVLASGRHWRIAIDRVECNSILLVDTRIDYLGPHGAVEAPVIRLVDREGRAIVPKSLVWKSGSKLAAQWLSAGGVQNIKPQSLGQFELKFALPEGSHDLNLELGDIRSFAVTRKGACLKPYPIRAPKPAAFDPAKLKFPVHRARYPCVPPATIAADHPPYLPKQLLLLGRGFLPNAREIELPMGKAPAQAYAYAGPDDLIAVENAARRALLADFPEYALAKHFAFNWGSQRSASGNEMYSIGIYELRACPK